MRRKRRRGRSIVAMGLVLPGLLLVCPYAFALDPALDVSQYAHTAWKVRDGFFKGGIGSIAQTPDGYLWLGTEVGLLRFDGVRAIPWQPPADQPLPSNDIYRLLVTRDGTLWIGTAKGLARWKDGKLTRYAELDGQYVFALLEDRDGSVWVGSVAAPAGKLCAIRNGSVQCFGEDGSLGLGVFGLYEDCKGQLWAGVRNGLWRWKPGPAKFYPLPGESGGTQGLGEDDDGGLLVGTVGGIKRVIDGQIQTYPLTGMRKKFEAQRLFRDRNGGLWIGTFHQGLVHIHNGRTDVFMPSEGLSSDTVRYLFEDREGTIWVATPDGLDRFRDLPVVTFRENQGLSNAHVWSVLADRDGSVWLGSTGGLNRWNHGQIMIPRTSSDKQDGKLNGENPNSLFQDGRGRMWVSTLREFGYLEDGRFVSVARVAGAVRSIAEDTDGNLWLAYQDHGLFQLHNGRVTEQIPWASLGHKDFASALVADPLHHGLWLGFFNGGIANFKDGKVYASYATADGLGEGRVNTLRLEPDGTLWAATGGGLRRLKNGRAATLTSKDGLPCDAVHWSIEDDVGSVWLYMPCGLVRIARRELDAWAVEVDKDKNAKPTIHATVFESSDGVRSLGAPSGVNPLVAKTADGKLWFLPWDGVSVVDPRHLPFNNLPPPVHIEQITADRNTYDTAFDGAGDGNRRLRLPPLVRDLQIDYTALSLVAAEKVMFRYKLEGWDRDWQDVGTRRQAFYSNLPPKNYTFRVKACNNSGVWNESGTFLDFAVAPAYYQTTWFRLSSVAALLALLWALYQLRLRQVAQQFNVRLEERVGERTRIARDLHDTLLQSFQGLLLRFQTVSNLLSAGEPKQKLDDAIDQAAQAITEGRDAVQGLRSSTKVANDLACAITTLGGELASGETNANAAEFHVEVEGTPRDIHPILRDEVYRIAGEALRNAFKHAQARRIEVEIHYDERQLRLRVRDDGKGIDAKHLKEGGRPGHYGLGGMRERAKLMGGKLTVWSEMDAGTEVELRIPASRAYETAPGRRRSWLAEKLTGKETEIKS